MVLTIDLSPEQAQHLAQIAEREGRDVAEVAVALLSESIDDDAWEHEWTTRAVTAWEASDRATRPSDQVWSELEL